MLEKATRYLLPLFLIGLAVVIGLKLLTLLVPILLAYLVSLPLGKLAQAIAKKTRLHPGIVTAFLVFLTLAVVGALIGFGVYRLVVQLSGFQNYLSDIGETVKQITEQLPKDGIFSFMPNFYNTAMDNLSEITGFATKFIVERVKALPSFLISLLFFLLSLFFFMKDAPLIERKKQELFARWDGSDHMRRVVGKTVLQYLRAQLLLMSITFAISFVLLMLYGIPYFPLVALGIAFVDVLPLLGPAVVYMPWIGFTLLTRDFKLAVLLAVAYAVTTLTRQILEPKIVSTSMGVHPLFTISTLCASYGLFGAKGLLIGIFLVMLVLVAMRVVAVVKEEKTKIQTRAQESR